jgi:hypothetical protein
MSSNSASRSDQSFEGFTEPSLVSDLTTEELKQHIHNTRQRISSTLDDLEDKANIPKQLGKARQNMEKKFATLKRDRPLLLVGVGVGAVTAAIAIVVVAVKTARK